MHFTLFRSHLYITLKIHLKRTWTSRQRPPARVHVRHGAMDKPCTLLVHFDKGSAAMANEIKADLEGSDVAAKVEAMKRAVMLLLNGETLPTPARTKCILHSTACVYIRNTC